MWVSTFQSILFALIIAFVFYQEYCHNCTREQQTTWPQVLVTIVDNTVERSTYDSSLYKSGVVYTYQWEGEAIFQSITTPWRDSCEAAEADALQYPLGTTLEAYVDPSNHQSLLWQRDLPSGAPQRDTYYFTCILMFAAVLYILWPFIWGADLNDVESSA